MFLGMALAGHRRTPLQIISKRHLGVFFAAKSAGRARLSKNFAEQNGRAENPVIHRLLLALFAGRGRVGWNVSFMRIAAIRERSGLWPGPKVTRVDSAAGFPDNQGLNRLN